MGRPFKTLSFKVSCLRTNMEVAIHTVYLCVYFVITICVNMF